VNPEDSRLLSSIRVATIALALVALVAFWPTYLHKPAQDIDLLTHLHALTMALWFAMLIAQPALALSGHLAWHRAVGYCSYALFPAILVLAFLVMHLHLRQSSAAEVAEYAADWYIVPSMASAFWGAYMLAIANRHRPQVHGFYMLCTSLTFVNPVLQRIYDHNELLLGEARQELVNFVLVDAVLAAIALHPRVRRELRGAAVTMLVVFLAVQIPRFTLATTHTWFRMIVWFRDLH
jgi:hypothetical protein